MNPESEEPTAPLTDAQDRLTDALLAEHARLGKSADDELVSTILLNTVNAPTDISKFNSVPAPAPVPSPQSAAGFGWGDWAKVAAIVIAIVGTGLFFLNQNPSQPVATKPVRNQETFHLVVKYVENPDSATQPNRTPKKVLFSTTPGNPRALPIEIKQTGSIESFHIAETDLPAPSTQFDPSIKNLPDVTSVRSTFTLASNETRAEGDKVFYKGEVQVSNSEFTLNADSLVLDKSGNDVPVLTARNATLSHKGGIYESVADLISFHPDSGKLIATGVRKLVNKGKPQEIDQSPVTVVFDSDKAVIEKSKAAPEVEE